MGALRWWAARLSSKYYNRWYASYGTINFTISKERDFFNLMVDSPAGFNIYRSHTLSEAKGDADRLISML